jgi:hypothetical protein
MNESVAKYVIICGEEIIAVIYESEKWGRTIVQQGKMSWSSPIQIYSLPDNKLVKSVEFAEFVHSVLFL